MKNIIAYSLEKLYRDLEEADELFPSFWDERHGVALSVCDYILEIFILS